ncbi:MAG: response regulator [Myxococcota bacterium]
MKLKSVLLIDDNDADNYLHRLVIERSGVADQVDVARDGQQALEYLTTPDAEGKTPSPDLILLDINMPVMNGWEFLDAYESLDSELQSGVVIMMLTTSVNPDDVRRAQERSAVQSFLTKPLDATGLQTILSENFPGY